MRAISTRLNHDGTFGLMSGQEVQSDWLALAALAANGESREMQRHLDELRHH
jgi:hypothetical protein